MNKSILSVTVLAAVMLAGCSTTKDVSDYENVDVARDDFTREFRHACNATSTMTTNVTETGLNFPIQEEGLVFLKTTELTFMSKSEHIHNFDSVVFRFDESYITPKFKRAYKEKSPEGFYLERPTVKIDSALYERLVDSQGEEVRVRLQGPGGKRDFYVSEEFKVCLQEAQNMREYEYNEIDFRN